MKFSVMHLIFDAKHDSVLTMHHHFKFETKCHKLMEHKLVEEKRPICKFDTMTENGTPLQRNRLIICQVLQARRLKGPNH